MVLVSELMVCSGVGMGVSWINQYTELHRQTFKNFVAAVYAARAMDFPTSRFPVIYADPPWAYRKEKLVNRGRARAVEKEYPTMQPEEIAALPVAQCTPDDAVLFMWATGPKLPLALMVMAAWGFEYRTIAFIWVKLLRNGDPFVGMGFYTRANAEMVLVGTKGKGLKRKDAGVRQIVLTSTPYDGPEMEALGLPMSIGHSEKPVEVRRRIELLYDGPYLELFSREAPDNWSVWGNQVPEDKVVNLDLLDDE